MLHLTFRSLRLRYAYTRLCSAKFTVLRIACICEGDIRYRIASSLIGTGVSFFRFASFPAKIHYRALCTVPRGNRR